MDIKIKSTKRCDSRTLAPGQNVDPEVVKEDTLLHIDAVKSCGDFLCDRITKQFARHDHTKLGGYLPLFTQAINSRLTGDQFKELKWWQIHLTERHHLNDKVPENVNLIDVLEMISDCVSAGMARTGKVYDVTLDGATLEKAFKNTVELIKKNIKVEE